ncbi:hypothetical protein C6501_10695, partial [Candidatus Poribacteria bacterium]
MRKRMIWGLIALMILIIGGAVFLFVKNQAEIRQLERDAAAAAEMLRQRDAQAQAEKSENANGHFHEDGTFHEGAPPDPIQTQPPTRDYTPAQVKTPEGITDPDVQAAWERVEYIANNIWAFGGVASPRAEELISALYPPTIGDDSHGEGEMDLLSELRQYRDPRAAVVFATYTGENIISGEAMNEALVEIGVPAVPYLLPYIEPPYDLAVKDPGAAAFALGRIGVQHREELAGVIEHIIIPKL